MAKKNKNKKPKTREEEMIEQINGWGTAFFIFFIAFVLMKLMERYG